VRGSPIVPPVSAPTSVARFHSTNTDQPVPRKPVRAAGVLSRVTDIAVDSSMSRCAAPARRQPRHPRSGASRRPYNVLRVPSSSPVTAPAIGLPPAPSTPTKANWEAPVKTSSDRAQACSTERPAATEIAPKEMP
jgi:hypothetical protein